ncbi:MAG: ABC transporter ATP-binding protein [Bacillota bacterium]
MLALQMSQVETGYGKISVFQNVNLKVHKAEIVTVVGPNGAGKTTLLKAICGLLPLWHGEIYLWAEKVNDKPAHKRATHGVTLVPEGARVFGDLTVAENLEMGAFIRNDSAEVQRDLEMVLGLFPVLKERFKYKARQLSGGQRQMLAIGRGLMSKAGLILLDEPSLGLSPILVEEVYEKLMAIRSMGTTILLVEQAVKKAFEVADRGYVMAHGKIMAEGTVEKLAKEEQLLQAYFGAI